MIEILFQGFVVGVMTSFVVALICMLLFFIVKEWQFVLCLIGFVIVMVLLGTGVRKAYHAWEFRNAPHQAEAQ